MLPDHLPTPATSFVGRTEELAAIAALLADPNCRLLTLVGSGGIGKTRLALQAGTDQLVHFAHGVSFVPLTPLSSPDLIASAIAGALRVSCHGPEAPDVQIVNYLRSKQMLLVMDNFEQLLEGTGLLTEILQSATGVKILVTSRERLNIQEEWAFGLGGLLFPLEQASEPLESYSAVQLFVQRAYQTQNSFSLSENVEAVRTICQRVEGMPLGLELAASWLRAMSCRQIAVQMENSLEFLATPLRNVPERHRSLRAVFEQSWNLLSESERTVLMRLSLFRGGFDLEAAQQIAGTSLLLLARLVDKSLIRLNAPDRYDLHELLRQFVADKLVESDETVAGINRRHLAFYSNLADEAEAHLYGPQREAWFDRLELEHDNFRAGLAWTLRDEEAEAGLHLAGALGFFWEHHAYYHEGGKWLEKLLTTASDVSASTRAKALCVAGALAGGLGNYDHATACCAEGLRLARESGDQLSIAWALGNLGFVGETYDDLSRARLEESLALFREIRDGFGISHMLRRLAGLLIAQGDYVGARIRAEEALTLAREAQDMNATAWALAILARGIWSHSHDPKQTFSLMEESLSLAQAIGDQFLVAFALFYLGQVAQALGDYGRAQTRYAESLTTFREMGTNKPYAANNLVGFGELAEVQGRPERAARLLGAASAFSESTNSILPMGGDIERDIPALRTQLGEAAFAAAWAEGKAMTSEQAVTYALHQETAPAKTPPQNNNQLLAEPLSARELEVLRLIAEGLSNAEIAHKLSISLATVKVHAGNIYTKLGVNNRTQAVTQAQKLNLL